MSKIGIFSGTFDPIHDGHVLFAQTAKEQMGLDKVVFMPEPKPRRKDTVSDISYRAAMIGRITDKAPDFELKLHKEEQHSVDGTLAWLNEQFPDDELYLIMGADVFENLLEWPGHQKLIASCGFIVALLTEDDGEIVVPMAKQIGVEAEFFPSPLVSVRSSKIRQAIVDGLPAKGLDDDVAEFINEHGLYQ